MKIYYLVYLIILNQVSNNIFNIIKNKKFISTKNIISFKYVLKIISLLKVILTLLILISLIFPDLNNIYYYLNYILSIISLVIFLVIITNVMNIKKTKLISKDLNILLIISCIEIICFTINKIYFFI